MCNNRLPPPSQGRNGLSVSCHPVVLRLIIALRHTPQPSCLSLFYALPFEDAFPRFSLLKSLFFLEPRFQSDVFGSQGFIVCFRSSNWKIQEHNDTKYDTICWKNIHTWSSIHITFTRIKHVILFQK